jgi:thiazole synthase
VNTAIGTARDPAAMGRAFRLAVEAGRAGYLAGLPAAGPVASASSPLTGFLS